MKYPTLKLEDCGRFFDDYVLTNIDKKTYIEASAKDLPHKILKKVKPCPELASALVEIFRSKERALITRIEREGAMKQSDFKKLLKLL